MKRGMVKPRLGRDGKVIRWKDGSISWLLKYEGARDPASNARTQCYKTVRAKRKSDAERELTRLLREVDAGEHVKRDVTTFTNFADHWLEHVAPRRAKAGRTRQRYGEILRCYVYPTLGDEKVQKISSAMIDRLYTNLEKGGGRDGRPLARRTVFHAHRLLSEIFRKASRSGVISRNPCDGVEPPSPDRTPAKAFKLAEVKQLLDALAGDHLLPIVRLALVTGARRGELAGLRWSDIDRDNRALTIQRSIEKVKRIVDDKQPRDKWTVWTGQADAKWQTTIEEKPPKTDRSIRTIRLGQSDMDMLTEHRARLAQEWLRLGVGLCDDDYVFPAAPAKDQKQGERPRVMDPDRITQQFAAVLVRLGIKARGRSFHSLRHTNATMLLWQKVDDKVVAQRIGHSTTKQTRDTYQHLVPDMEDEAANIASAIIAPAPTDKPA